MRAEDVRPGAGSDGSADGPPAEGVLPDPEGLWPGNQAGAYPSGTSEVQGAQGEAPPRRRWSDRPRSLSDDVLGADEDDLILLD